MRFFLLHDIFNLKTVERSGRDRVFIFTLILVSLIEALTHFASINYDSASYVGLALYFQGRGSLGLWYAGYRTGRPLVPFLASILGSFMGIVPAFGIVNTLLWCASSIVMYKFSKDILGFKSFASFVAALLLATSFIFLDYGGSVLTDMGGFFFILVGSYVWMRVAQAKRLDLRLLVLGSLATGVGILARESVVVVPLFAITYALLTRRRVGAALLFAALCGSVDAVWLLISHTDYSTLYRLLGQEYASTGPWKVALSFLVAFNLALPFALLGFLKGDARKMVRFALSMLLAGLIVVLAWPVADARFSFIVFPSVFPLASAGMMVFGNRVSGKAPFDRMPGFVWILLVLVIYALATNYVTHVSLPGNYYAYPGVCDTYPGVCSKVGP